MTRPADGTPYTPSNGTEGMDFYSRNCDCCTKRGNIEEPDCPILAASFCASSGAKEWQYRDGKPTCTAFAALPKLGIDGEPLPEPDPRQLTLEVA